MIFIFFILLLHSKEELVEGVWDFHYFGENSCNGQLFVNRYDRCIVGSDTSWFYTCDTDTNNVTIRYYNGYDCTDLVKVEEIGKTDKCVVDDFYGKKVYHEYKCSSEFLVPYPYLAFDIPMFVNDSKGYDNIIKTFYLPTGKCKSDVNQFVENQAKENKKKLFNYYSAKCVHPWERTGLANIKVYGTELCLIPDIRYSFDLGCGDVVSLKPFIELYGLKTEAWVKFHICNNTVGGT